jgi:hypothetical protein
MAFATRRDGRMGEPCINKKCGAYEKDEDYNCGHITLDDPTKCKSYLKANKEPVADVLCNVGLCTVEVEEEKTPSGWVQPYVSLRIGNFEFKRNYHTRHGAENCVNKIREMLIEE